ncbi:hypothetical protein ABFS83_06G137900 [Erythranthe nasuta]
MGTNYNVYTVLGCFSRKFKITDSQPPPDVRAAFWRYAEGAPQMTAVQFLKFLVDCQREEGYTVADAEAIIQNVFRRRSHVSRRNGLTLEDFFDFLFQDDLNAPIISQVHHDMSGPLQHYFIFTGHNSYLTGNQLSSDCSEIPIINALKNGVRGIELDLWPNSTKDNVHVLHGRTLTTPVTLNKCLKSIREHAFVSSPYPVIVTLEDHLTPDLQAKVAAMVMQIFGDMLYCPDPESSKEFPSPEALKHKIILSTKPPKEYLSLKIAEDGENIPSPQEKDSSEDEQLPTETSKPTVEPEVQEAKNDREGDKEDSDPTIRQKSGNVGGHEYKQRIGVRAGKAKRGLRQVLRTGIDKVNRLSQSERKAILSNKPPKGYNIASNTNNKVEDQTPTPHDKFNLLSQSERKATLSNKPHKDYNIGSNTNNDKVEDRTHPPHAKQESFQDEDDEYKSGSSDEDDEYGDNFEQRSGSLGAAPEYKRIIGIHAGNAKKGLMQALKIEADNVSHRLSLSEQRLEKAASLHATDVVRFTQKNILRVFPKGTRVTSSNFRPTTGWMHGAQMVAFNMQGYGKSLWMMHGLFRANGGCGYFKKPDLLTSRGPNDEVFDPKLTATVKKTLKVTVYMGDGWALDFSQTHFDAYSPPDFYTKVHIVGVPADAAKRKTRVIEDDWMPYWDEEFSFPLTVPELALLRIEVREHDLSEKDDFGGQTCLPVSELRPGIRCVPLYDKKGHKYKSVKLLMKFHFE